jgi:hypothetical protein
MLEKLVDAFILSWGICYITAPIMTKKSLIVKPKISKPVSFILMWIIGCSMCLSLFIQPPASTAIFIAIGLWEVLCIPASYLGTIRWNIPWEDDRNHALAMAGLDMVAAVCLFSKVL